MRVDSIRFADYSLQANLIWFIITVIFAIWFDYILMLIFVIWFEIFFEWISFDSKIFFCIPIWFDLTVFLWVNLIESGRYSFASWFNLIGRYFLWVGMIWRYFVAFSFDLTVFWWIYLTRFEWYFLRDDFIWFDGIISRVDMLWWYLFSSCFDLFLVVVFCELT